MKDPQPSSVVAPPPFWKRPLFRWSASLVILALLVRLLPLGDLVAAFRRIPGRVWMLALPFYLTLHLMGVLKWRTLVNASGGGLSFSQALRCYWYGLFGNTFLPSVAGGDFLRAGLAFRLAKSPSGVVVGSVVDRILDIVALGVVAGVGVASLPHVLDLGKASLSWAAAVLVVVSGAAASAAVAFLPFRRVPRRFRRPWIRALRALHAARRRPLRLTGALVLGVALQGSLVFLNAWLGWACGIEIGWTAWLFVWPVAKLSAMLPITQGGLGVREAALAALFAPFGVPPGLAVAAGLVFQGVVISGGLLGGGLARLLGALAQDPDHPAG
jgi:uncharacterized membrane protein YbhN (UPF0104 family)